MTFADRKSLSKIAAQSKETDYKLASLIEGIVLSDLSRNANLQELPMSNIFSRLASVASALLRGVGTTVGPPSSRRDDPVARRRAAEKPRTASSSIFPPA